MRHLEDAEHRRIYEFARSVARSVDIKGSYFPGHSDGVAYIVALMGMEYGKDADDITELKVACLMHDAGKVSTPDRILNAPRKLTHYEYEVIKLHSERGQDIALGLGSGLDSIAGWVRHHHERWDGKGYPDGLAGENIPWQSRWIFVADAFNVMTSNRPYQRARDRNKAFDELQRCRGSQFCPEAVDILFNYSKRGHGFV